MAFRAFFEKRGKYPRFKSKRDRPSFCAATGVGFFRADGKSIKLPVIGWVRMREAVRFSGPLKRATVSCEAGRWFVALMIETDDVQPVTQPEAVVGVDLGVTTLATLSTGEAITGPKVHKTMLGAACGVPTRLGAQAPRLGELPQGQGTAGTAARPHRQRPQGRHSQADDAAGQDLSRDRH